MPIQYHAFCDHDLVLSLQKGESGALLEIARRYWRDLYEEACKKTQSSHVAEEIIQQLFSELWGKRKQLNEASSSNFLSDLKTSLKHKVLRYALKDIVRKKHSREKKYEHPEEALRAYHRFLNHIKFSH